jgi:hypothetical protein
MNNSGKIQIEIDMVSGRTGTTSVRRDLNQIDEDVARIHRNAQRHQKETERVIQASVKSIADTQAREDKERVRQQKARANEFLATMQRLEAESNSTAQKSSSAWSSAFAGGLFGGFVGATIAQLNQIPTALKQTLDEAISIAAERQNALKGLESISLFKNVNPDDAKRAISDLRLVKAGVVDMGDAVTGLKNLLAAGFSLPQSITLLERFSDAAAFGKQSALSYGDAIRSATEGVKNQNSVLVDNAGVTKNLSVILKEAGFKMEDLTDKTKGQAATLALYNGLVTETQAQVGDADKLTQTYTGSTAALDMAQKELLATIGEIIIKSPAMQQANREVTEQLTGYTRSVKDANSETSKFVKDATDRYAAFKASVVGTTMSAVSAVSAMVTGLAAGLGGVLALAAGSAEIMVGGVAMAANKARSVVVDLINWTIDKVQANPWLALAVGPGLLGAQKLEPVNVGSLGDYMPVTKELLRATENLWNATKSLVDRSNKFGREADQAYNRVMGAGNPWQMSGSDDDYAAYRSGQLPLGRGADPAGDSTGKSTGGKGSGSRGSAGTRSITNDVTSNQEMAKYQAALRRLDPALRTKILEAAVRYGIPESLALAQIYSESTFKTTARSEQGAAGLTQVMPGTAARFGQTSAGMSNPDNALTVWGKYMTFLFNRYGDWQLAVLAYHQGEGTVDKLVAALGKGRSGTGIIGPKGRAYVQKISGLAGLSGDSRYSPADASRMLSEQSDVATKEARESNLRAAMQVWKSLGIIPDSKMIDEFQKLLAADARKIGAIQPNSKDVERMFTLSAADPAISGGTLSTNPTSVSAALSARMTPDEDYVKRFREALNINQRMETLIYEQRNHQGVISELIKSQILGQKERLDAIEKEFEVIKALDLNKEARLTGSRERNELLQDTQKLEIAIANVGVNSAGRYKRAWLAAVLDIKDAHIRANEEIIRANVRLDDARVYHSEQAKAKILDHLSQQKTQTDLVADAFIEAFERAGSGIDKLLDKMKIGTIPIVGNYLKGLARANLTQMTRGIVDKIFPGMSDSMEQSQNPLLFETKQQTKLLKEIRDRLTGSPASSALSPSSGGGLGSIFSSGSGPGGTPFFNPTQGGGVPPTGTIDADGNYVVNGNQQQGGLGGILGNFKGMFGAKKNMLTGKMSSSAGMMGGIGSIASMVGGFIPGRAGRTLQYAGMGAQLGANFGPWGAAIGAGVGALFGLFGGRDNATKKLKEAALSTYSISVGDKSVLEAMKTIGEGYYGKGKVGQNAMAVVGLSEVQEILRNYAATSGQKSSKLDRDLYADEDWSGNQFKSKFGGFRERGGPVTAGRAYVVGERRPEVFVPNVSGTILPSVPNVTVNSGMDAALIASLAESIYELKEEVAQFKTMSPGALVKSGAREAGDAIVSASADRYNDSFSARERTARNLQYE